MNEYSNSSWAFYSENLDLHIAASIRGLRLLVFYARLRFFRSFFEAEQHGGNDRALGGDRYNSIQYLRINLSSLPLLGYLGVSTRKQLTIPMTNSGLR